MEKPHWLGTPGRPQGTTQWQLTVFPFRPVDPQLGAEEASNQETPQGIDKKNLPPKSLTTLARDSVKGQPTNIEKY